MIKLKNIITEAKELDQSYIKRAAIMTDKNHHSEAREALCRGLKDKKLALGTWQGLYLFEHRLEEHTRTLSYHLIGN